MSVVATRSADPVERVGRLFACFTDNGVCRAASHLVLSVPHYPPFTFLERLLHTLVYLPVSVSLHGYINSDRAESHKDLLSFGKVSSTDVLQDSAFCLSFPYDFGKHTD